MTVVGLEALINMCWRKEERKRGREVGKGREGGMNPGKKGEREGKMEGGWIPFYPMDLKLLSLEISLMACSKWRNI